MTDLRNWATLIDVEEAARSLGIEPKRLRGLIARNSLWDPIGDFKQVYVGSLEHTKRQLQEASE